MNEHSLIYMTKLYDEAMELNTKLQEELENLKNTNEEHRVLNGKLREENKRLNNIINELKKGIENMYVDDAGEDIWEYEEEYLYRKEFLDKIEELKGSDKE